jgi:CDGSH-type Zn-finger protein/uncharacterized Fe-S cluster protein YjdI
MEDKRRTYIADDLDVHFELARCIHSAECVRNLPEVFDTSRKPWVDPTRAPADQVAKAVQRCPTGALKYTRKDGGAPEKASARNTAEVIPNGPLYLRGDLEIVDSGTIVRETRVSLCRCGASANKPFCDGAHTEVGFRDDGHARIGKLVEVLPEGPLTIKLVKNGPLSVRGPLEITDAAGRVVFRSDKLSLCRCGASGNKPLCDGKHMKIKFVSS